MEILSFPTLFPGHWPYLNFIYSSVVRVSCQEKALLLTMTSLSAWTSSSCPAQQTFVEMGYFSASIGGNKILAANEDYLDDQVCVLYELFIFSHMLLHFFWILSLQPDITYRHDCINDTTFTGTITFSSKLQNRVNITSFAILLRERHLQLF